MNRLIVVVLLMVLLGAVSDAWGAAGDGYHYRYFKESRALVLDPGRVAVMAPEGRDAGRVHDALSAVGLSGNRAAAHSIRSWAVAGTDGARGVAAGGVERAVDALAAREDVGFASPVFIDGLGGEMFVTGRVLVRFRDGIDGARIAGLFKDHGFVVGGEANWGGMRGAYRATAGSKNGFSVLAAANALAMRDEVLFAEPDMVFTGRGGFTPNDPEFGNCWGHRNTGQFGGASGEDMNTDQAWDTTVGDPSILVVVIDTGVDQAHPDIHQVGGNDFTSDASTDGSPVNSFDNHGTAVAGCVSATIDNNLGTVGSAPGCRSASARAFITTNSNGNWTSSVSWTVDALTWAETIGARVTNNSNGYGFTSASIESKYASTRSGGMVHFASAGNDNGGPITYPATLGTVNAVAAVDVDGLRAGFSNIGTQMAYAAPGVSVRTTDRQGASGYSGADYAYVQGTSFASPYAAGVAALLLSENDQLSSGQVETILATTARDKGSAGWDTSYGWGFINAKAAVDEIVDPLPPGDFDLVAPADGSIAPNGDVDFVWTNSPLAQTYRLLVDDDIAFASPFVDQLSSLAEFTVSASNFIDGERYFWTVIASNAVGDTEATGGPYWFVRNGPVPTTPLLVDPIGGEQFDILQVDLVWVGGSNTLSYRVEVDDDPAFGTPEVVRGIDHAAGLLQTPVGLPELIADTVYHWRVIGVNYIGETISTPSAGTFKYGGPPAGRCAGDANNSGLVDVNDISFVLFRLGDSGVCVDGDANGDGLVDVNDISYVLFRLGNSPEGLCDLSPC